MVRHAPQVGEEVREVTPKPDWPEGRLGPVVRIWDPKLLLDGEQRKGRRMPPWFP